MFGNKKLLAEIEALRTECDGLKVQVEGLGREVARLMLAEQPDGKAIVSVPSEEGELWLKRS